eukprot:TRINITY_DN3453_c0_g1_i1.p1 TRINITY_DN3453_c0_g1~~TRINITY_DN3453_c0_g1_i1.p1  ORF type:complete len:730 (-),score=135.87 TRINITY_DN3453_c0_g1_i1:3-2192(-)
MSGNGMSTPPAKRRRRCSFPNSLPCDDETPEKTAKVRCCTPTVLSSQSFLCGKKNESDAETEQADVDAEDSAVPWSQTDNSTPARDYKFSLPGSTLGFVPRSYQQRHQRTVCDRVHGQVILEPLLVAVVDTPEFQRLRKLKQLGGTDHVFPGGTHSRFEHSLGVAHLAGLMVESLQRKQPELAISNSDVLCVKLAGLVHDLGHGPFSHMFETFVNRIRLASGKSKWHHEACSRSLLMLLLSENQILLEDYFPCDSAESPAQQLEFVMMLIEGLAPGAPWPDSIGRPPAKRFLFDIVANKRNGIDVDKLDYFHRDIASVFGSASPLGCDIPRLLESVRVLSVEGETQVCFEEKMALNLGDIYRTRSWMHKFVYLHHTAKAVETMMCDVLVLSKDVVEVRGMDNKPVKLADAVEDPVAFSKLGDWILDFIWASCDARLAEAQQLLARIYRRELYRQVVPCCNLPSRRDLSDLCIDSKRDFVLRCSVERSNGSVAAVDELLKVSARSLKELQGAVHKALVNRSLENDWPGLGTYQLMIFDQLDENWRLPTSFQDVPSRAKLLLRLVKNGAGVVSEVSTFSTSAHATASMTEKGITEQLLAIASRQCQSVKLAKEDFYVQLLAIEFGKNAKTKLPCDPIQSTCFFNPKIDLDRAVFISQERRSVLFTPQAFSETIVYIYSKSQDHKVCAALRQAAGAWRREVHGILDDRSLAAPTNNFSPCSDDDDDDVDLSQ